MDEYRPLIGGIFAKVAYDNACGMSVRATVIPAMMSANIDSQYSESYGPSIYLNNQPGEWNDGMYGGLHDCIVKFENVPTDGEKEV